MSPANQYKKIEKQLSRRFMGKLRSGGRSISKGLGSLRALGKQRFTVMFIPHSERKIFNFQINVFSLTFVLGLTALMAFGFIALSTHFTGTARMLSARTENLENAHASLESIREEVAELQKVSRVFQNSLNKTLGILGISVPGRSQPETGQGDLSSFVSVAEVDANQLRELHDVRNIKTFLETAIDPLEEIRNVLSNQKDLLTDIPTLWPLKGVRGRITNNFGPAEHPFTGQWYLHKGIDIAYGTGVPILATARGKVLTIDYEPNGFGNYVVIRHKYGFYTKYAHLHRFNVKRGDEVQQGQVIGTMGNTGLSTGPHLHYEVRIGSEVVDPAKYLNISRNAVALWD